MSYLIAARRSAVVPKGGAFARDEIWQLAQPVIQGLLADAGIVAEQVEQLICGNGLGAGGNPARMVALAAGMPAVAGLSIDTQCTSGLEAIALAHHVVSAGSAQIIVAGGAESYSRRPLRARPCPDGGEPVFYLQSAFSPDPDADPSMHQAAAELASLYAVSREVQEQFATDSHRRAMDARQRLMQEIIPVHGVSQDLYTRHLSLAVARRTPCLAGSVSVSSTAVEADGAAFVLVVSDRVCRRLKPPFAVQVTDHLSGAGDSRLPAAAPVALIQALLERNPQVDPDRLVTEMMEAYAVQALVCIQQSGLNMPLTNCGGGALARGHPIGASGAILACRLWHELRQRGGDGLCAIAAAGGIASALLCRAVS